MKKPKLSEMQRRKAMREAFVDYDELPIRCQDCGKIVVAADVSYRTNRKIEWFMLMRELWQQVCPADTYPWGVLCVLCVEQRLGRQLTSADFDCGDQDACLRLLPSTPILTRRRATPDARGMLHGTGYKMEGTAG